MTEEGKDSSPVRVSPALFDKTVKGLSLAIPDTFYLMLRGREGVSFRKVFSLKDKIITYNFKVYRYIYTLSYGYIP